MKRKAVIIIAAVLVLCLFATLFVACNKRDKLPSATPVSWEKHLRDAADRLAESIMLSGGRMGVKLTAEILAPEGRRELLFGINYDLNDASASCAVLTLGDGATADASAAADGVLFSIVSNSTTTWVDIAPGLALPDARMKIENLNVFDLLGTVYNEENAESAVSAFSDILVNLGKTFFGGVRAGADEYHFFVNGDYKQDGAEYFSAVMTVLGENVAGALLSAFGISDAEELLGLFPDMSGEVTLTFTDGGAELATDGLTMEGGAAASAEFTTSSDLYPELAEMVPGDAETGYVVTKIGNSHMEGTLDAMSSGRVVMSYDYVLDANIDLLTLMLNDYDLGALEEDNYLHLRISHKCDASCGSFCKSRFGAARGAVLDIAFSPRDFESYNVYFSVALQALIGADAADAVTEDLGISASLLLPEYTLFTYPREKFDEDSYVCIMLRRLYAENMFSTDSVQVGTAWIVEILSHLFEDDMMDGTDSFVFNVELNEFGMAQPHDIYSQTVYIADDSDGEVKNYGSGAGSLALDWEWEQPSADGLTALYGESGELLHGDGVPMSPEELSGMMGEYHIRADCVGLDRSSTFTFDARVVDIKGLDSASREVQEVTLVVEYPGPYSTLDLLDPDAVTTLGLTCEVPARILLTDRTTAEVVFTPHVAADSALDILHADFPSSSGEYSGQVRELPEFLLADARVEYVNGYVKEMTVIGESDAVGVREMVIMDDLYYSARVGDISVQWEFMDGEYTCGYYVTPPDRMEYEIHEERMPASAVGSTVYMASILNRDYVKAVAVYGDKRVDIYLSAADVFINDIPLTMSGRYWTSTKMLLGGYSIVFNAANDYECRLKPLGMTEEEDEEMWSDTFVKRIEAYSGADATYKFVETSFERPFWFTGTAYTFSGEITNATHGVNDEPQRELILTVERYDAEHTILPVAVDITSPDAAVTLTANSFTANKYFLPDASQAGVLVAEEFPALITSAVNVSFRLTFNTPGYYEITLRLSGSGGFRQEWYITVAE